MLREDEIRAQMRANTLSSEPEVLARLMAFAPDAAARQRITQAAAPLVAHLREDTAPGLMDRFLGEYGLSSAEGVALMCLAEALLRVPDPATIDALIEDKIAPSDWGRHLGQAHSSLVNASTWALFLTGKVLDPSVSVAGTLRGTVKRLGEPVIRTAVQAAMREMGRHFVLGQTINAARDRARSREAQGESYSYDMLGEAARTEPDAARYFRAYSEAIAALAQSGGTDIRSRPGISVKLSALDPRYEPLHHARVLERLVLRVQALARQAAAANIGFNIDAEEADRLDLSLDVCAAVLADPALAGWDGFGVVVQAYGKRASYVIDWLHALAIRLDRRIMVRLVKGAYWDTEVKLAQTAGLSDYPVFTRKAATDASFIACARQLMARRDRIYPQFATHNAVSMAAILGMGADPASYEFQRLHGMGAALHDHVRARFGTACRIYAPVGAHRDLLAYLVRRLLENGANSSFVNQTVDVRVPISRIIADPYAHLEGPSPVPAPCALYPGRAAAAGWDLGNPETRADLMGWVAGPTTGVQMRHAAGSRSVPVRSPIDGNPIGTAIWASSAQAEQAVQAVQPWGAPADTRGAVLRRAADLYEKAAPDFFRLLVAEAGKTLPDCISEVREAVDFLRYYADHAQDVPALGKVVCISPWNFPLAIFTGQIAGALAAGNGVVAKPAEATSLIADVAVGVLYAAGVPRDALRLVAGTGAEVGAALIAAGPDAVAFTGSTATAQRINRGLAAQATPGAPLVAETGGLNAMIVDSTALPEQAVRDIVASAFQSAGQRCSALRMLYLQEDVADDMLAMLKGAMDALVVGDPRAPDVDVGPVIDQAAKDRISAHIAASDVVYSVPVPEGLYVAPTLVRVSGIADLKEEIFGPVCHVATYPSGALHKVISDINATGYALTFGVHSRIDDRVEAISAGIVAGNIYVNRNQIGAVVGSQPFGGHGLSGTGPKAGGPRYVARFQARADLPLSLETALPGPTGESNRYRLGPRGAIACLGPSLADLNDQLALVARAGCVGRDARDWTAQTLGTAEIDAVLSYAPTAQLRQVLAQRPGRIVPLFTTPQDVVWMVHEHVVSIDTTAAGGNTALLAASDAVLEPVTAA